MFACRVLGHRLHFTAQGTVMSWECERGCGQGGGQKTYPTAAEAERFARGLNRKDSDDLGRRAPLIGLLPLRLWRRLRGRKD
ncbi:hypothetical protein [Arthrobacter castelli]|uniref:hypothetical protein n=1 Tax=Arthrobacter castelli TaxID=271431 RepID=UPI0004799245|nr:hypothetical protein [Arthrobacter castelli]